MIGEERGGLNRPPFLSVTLRGIARLADTERVGTRWLPPVLGLLTAVVYWWIWGALQPATRHFDETAYLLQARIFAQGQWTAPARPLPEFFEQFHVLVTPVLAAKYPPGHSLLLSLGQLVGFAALVPLLLNGLTGALIYVLASRLAGVLTGVLTWLLWLLTPINLIFRPSYFSNVTTGALWLLGWWALLNWWQSGARRWLLLLAGCVGWCAITRPFTALAFTLPVAVLVIRRVWQRALWTDLGLALALGTCVLAILPLANRRTTGHWLEMPWTTYARQYTPYDGLGFGFDSTPPLREPAAEMRRYNGVLRPLYQNHTLPALPNIAKKRLQSLLESTWIPLLLPLALLGAITMPAAGVLALLSAGLLFLAYLMYPHPIHWIVYYLEMVPAVAFAIAVGIVTLGRSGSRLFPRSRGVRHTLAAYAWIALAVWFLGAVQLLPWARRRMLASGASLEMFFAQLAKISAAKAIVFVRYRASHPVFQSLIMNEPDLVGAPVWVVQDRGADNWRLLALAPDRISFLYDQATNNLSLLSADSSMGPR